MKKSIVHWITKAVKQRMKAKEATEEGVGSGNNPKTDENAAGIVPTECHQIAQVLDVELSMLLRCSHKRR